MLSYRSHAQEQSKPISCRNQERVWNERAKIIETLEIKTNDTAKTVETLEIKTRHCWTQTCRMLVTSPWQCALRSRTLFDWMHNKGSNKEHMEKKQRTLIHLECNFLSMLQHQSYQDEAHDNPHRYYQDWEAVTFWTTAEGRTMEVIWKYTMEVTMEARAWSEWILA